MGLQTLSSLKTKFALQPWLISLEGWGLEGLKLIVFVLEFALRPIYLLGFGVGSILEPDFGSLAAPGPAFKLLSLGMSRNPPFGPDPGRKPFGARFWSLFGLAPAQLRLVQLVQLVVLIQEVYLGPKV